MVVTSSFSLFPLLLPSLPSPPVAIWRAAPRARSGRAKGRTSGERARAREFLLLSPSASFDVLRGLGWRRGLYAALLLVRRVYHCMHTFVSATPPRARPLIGIRKLFEEFLAGNRALLPLSSKSSGALRLVSRSFRLLLPLPSSLPPTTSAKALAVRAAGVTGRRRRDRRSGPRARPSLRRGGAPWGSRRLSGRCGGGGAGGVVAVQEGKKKTPSKDALLQGRGTTRTKTRT